MEIIQVIIEKWKSWKQAVLHSGCVPIRVQEDAVRKLHESYERVLKSRADEILYLDKEYKKEKDYSRSLIERITQLEIYCEEAKQELHQSTVRAVSAEELAKEKNTRLEMLYAIYTEEREERKELSSRIQEVAGLKRPDVVHSGPEPTNGEKVSIDRKSRTRSNVLRELETRAARLERENREREAKAVAEGNLAPIDLPDKNTTH